MPVELIKPQPPDPEPNLFMSTSDQAAHTARKMSTRRYLEILTALSHGPACIFEIAAALECHDHQISGRFGELVKALMIDRTGERLQKLATGCWCDQYRITMYGLAFLNQHSPNAQDKPDTLAIAQALTPNLHPIEPPSNPIHKEAKTPSNN